VGAAIAIGNQGEKGKIALLVQNVIRRKISLKLGIRLEEKKVREGIVREYMAIEHKKKASPIRFISKVKRPEKIEDWF
jgi:hypothetical protein